MLRLRVSSISDTTTLGPRAANSGSAAAPMPEAAALKGNTFPVERRLGSC